MPLLGSNPMWEDFGQRALLWAPTGGADFGECLATVQAIGAPPGRQLARLRWAWSGTQPDTRWQAAPSRFGVFDWLDQVLKLAATA
jgi:hypothetical protein